MVTIPHFGYFSNIYFNTHDLFGKVWKINCGALTNLSGEELIIC